MRKLIAFLSLLAFVGVALAQAPKEAAGSVEKALMKLEDELTDAIVRNDVARFEKSMGAQFVFIGPDAVVVERAKWLADMKAGDLKLQSSKTDEMKVRVFGDAAVVTYRSTDKGTYKGQDISGQYRWTDVFAKEGGAWKLVSVQGTPIPPPPKADARKAEPKKDAPKK